MEKILKQAEISAKIWFDHAKAITFADINRKWLRMTIKIVRNKNTEKKNNYAWSNHW